jgi:hypothetical protein
MAKAEDLYKKWLSDCPSEVDAADFRKFVEHYLGRWLRERGKSGSHLLIIEHPALSIAPSFGGNNTLSIAIKSGRKVKGVYVMHALKAIECIDYYERHVGAKGERT